jgi:hypothetical protein
MTFDRLKPDPNLAQAITVRDTSVPGRFTAVAVPPTLTLGPTFAHERARAQGLEDAVRANTNISPLRRDFLLRRMPYWSSWARNPGIATLGDEE